MFGIRLGGMLKASIGLRLRFRSSFKLEPSFGKPPMNTNWKENQALLRPWGTVGTQTWWRIRNRIRSQIRNQIRDRVWEHIWEKLDED